MGMLSKITATLAKNFFATPFQRANGVAALARINDINTMVDAVNTLANNSTRRMTYDFFVTSTPDAGGQLIVSRVNGGDVKVCQNLCPTDTKEEQKADKCCGAANYYNGIKITVKNPTYLGVGSYRISLDPYSVIEQLDGSDRIIDWQDTAILVGNPAAIGYVTVTKTTMYEYDINTYDSLGVASDSILSNTLLQVTAIPPIGEWNIADH